MFTKKITIGDPRIRSVRIGGLGELNATEVVFDCAKFVEWYGSAGTAYVVVKRYGEEPYIPTSQEYDTDSYTLTWTINGTDTSVDSAGIAEVRYVIDDELIAKTPLYNLEIRKNIYADPEEAPEWYEDYLVTITEAKTSAQNSATLAAASESNAALSATNAGNSALAAAASASSASDSALAAAQSASSASDSEDAAEDYMQSAQTYAGNASDYADNAATSEHNAASSATDAETAQTAAEAAQTAAERAKEAAESARETVEDLADTVAASVATISEKVNKPTSSPNGTAGQVLRTNGDGSTAWVDVGLPTDEQTAEAVSAWLDEHPEATTTIEDGAVTWAKLNSSVQEEIDGKAPAITLTSDANRTFTASELSDPYDYTLVIPQTNGISAEYIALVPDLFPIFDTRTTTLYTKTDGKNTITVSGSATGNFYYGLVDGVSAFSPNYAISEGDTVTLRIAKLSGSMSGGSEPVAYSFRLTYSDSTYTQSSGGNFPLNASYHEVSITAEQDVVSVSFTLYFRSGYTFTDLVLGWACIVNSSFTTYDSSSGLTLSKDVVGTNGVSMIPVDGYLYAIADTKTYIDEHVPSDMVTEEDLIYVTPEMYGATGIGTSSNDDYAALVACFADAISNGVPVRGFGKYFISSGIEIECDDMDIYLNQVITQTTTSDAVIKLTGYRNRIKINRIYAYNGNCDGFWLYGASDHWSEFNTIDIPYVFAQQNAVVISAESGAYACENKFYTQYLRSINANCINSLGGFGENSFWGGGQVICPRGWAIYECASGNKYYNFALESQARSGIYIVGPKNYGNYFTGFRIAELRGQKTEDSGDTGTLIKFGGATKYNVFECADAINLVDIDCSEAYSNSDMTADTVNDYSYGYNIVRGAGVKSNGYVEDHAVGHYTNFGGEVLCLRNQKICTPCTLFKIEVSEDIDYTTFYIPPLASYFVMTADANIYLNASYCCMGYNHFTIDQTSAKATVYDKNSTVIFDGSNLDAGVYEVSCYCDASSNIIRTLRPASKAILYDGENDTWVVRKIS